MRVDRRGFFKVLPAAAVAPVLMSAADGEGDDPKLRRIQIWYQDRWSDIRMENIREGDRFRMFEPSTGAAVKDGVGNTIFFAEKDAERQECNGRIVWGVSVKSFRNELLW